MTQAVTPEPQYATTSSGVGRAGWQRLLEEGVAGARDAAGDRVERLGVATPPFGRARVPEDERGVVESRADLVRLDQVVGPDDRHERRRRGGRSIRGERPLVRAEVERAAGIVAEVPQQPPAARRPARSLVVGKDERRAVDPRRPEGGGERVRVGERVSASDCRVVGRRGEVALGVEMHRAGYVPRFVGGERAAVDEHGHSAPREATGEHPDVVLGKPARELRRAGVRVVRPDDHGRPGARERRAAGARGRVVAERVERRRTGGTARAAGRRAPRRRAPASPAAAPAAEQRGAPGVRSGVGVRHGRGERAARRLGRRALARDERRRR